MELILIYLAFISFSPLFLILVFIIYLLCFGLSLVFLVGSYYYSYIVYLLFLSGLLVMFMYVCSVIFNEKMSINFNFFFLLLGGTVFLVLLFDWQIVWFSVGGGSGYCEFYSLLKFFSFSFSFFSLFFVLYLFICLVVVCEIIKKNSGPLRMEG